MEPLAKPISFTRILAIDPGALRLGWALVERKGDTYNLLESGIKGLDRDADEPFSDYRRRLIKYWSLEWSRLLYRLNNTYGPVHNIASERLPAVGGGNFIAATQSELAKVVITVCQTLAEISLVIIWNEWAANTVKKNLTGNAKATKVNIRNAVIEVFPELKPRKKEILADETDAIGIGLVALGYKHNGIQRSKSLPSGERNSKELPSL